VRTVWPTLLCCCLALAGCDGSDPADAGAPPSDAGSTIDAGASADAGGAMDGGPMMTVDAGGGEDAGAMMVADAGPMMTADAGLDAGTDAGPPPDGGALVPGDVCTSLCNRLLMCSPMAPPGELGRCISECSADLADCSTAQLATLRACADAPDACDTDPVSMAPKLLMCVMAESCVMG